jgi:hypothetical protein
MTFRLGVYSFGNTPLSDGDGLGPTSLAIRDMPDAIKLTGRAGLLWRGGASPPRHAGLLPELVDQWRGNRDHHRTGQHGDRAVHRRPGTGISTAHHADVSGPGPCRDHRRSRRDRSFPLYGYRPQGSGALYASKLEQVIEAVSIIGTYDPMEISAVTPAVRGYHTRPAGNERF